ncbi:MAG: hypothetical protein KBS83_00940 [Lachnospiraceae bacterium]|nr:hypothetical protein [Candidatus Equihabitans merdae]
MSEDFFGDLSKQLGVAAQTAVDKTSSFIEQQKTSIKISAALHEVEKMYQVIGEMVVLDPEGASSSENVKNLVAEVLQKKAEIEAMKKDVAKMRGVKICEVCGNRIRLEDMYCSKCGAEAPVEEVEEVVEEVVEEAPAEEAEAPISEEVAEAIAAAKAEVEAAKEDAE